MLESILTLANGIVIFLVYKVTKNTIKDKRYNQKLK